MNRHLIRIALLCLSLALTACGGDRPSASAPVYTATLTPEASSELGAMEPVKVVFGGSMNPSSLQLGRGMDAQASVTWSTTDKPNDTLTLSPPASGWIGQPALSVQVSSSGGVAQPPLSASFQIVTRLSTFQAASVVIGQPDFTSSAVNQGNRFVPGANTLYNPYGQGAIGPDGQFFLTDTNNHRLLGFRQLPTSNNVSADWVIGQPDFTTRVPGIGPLAFAWPTSVAIHGQVLAMADKLNARVLIWNRLPTATGTAPDVVLGQPDLVSNGLGCSATQLNSPGAVTFTPGGRLIVADTDNSRVLVWNTLPTRHGQPPDLVLGQSDFTHCRFNDDNQDGANEPTPTARTMYTPTSVWSDDSRLVISDRDNHRVVVWNTFPTSNFQPADIVLGQSGFTHKTPNDDDQDRLRDDAPTARTLYAPEAVAGNGVQLAVGDPENYRVLIWNRMPTSSFQPADVVLGQGDFTRMTRDDTDQDGFIDPTPSAYTTAGPAGLFFHGNRLILTQDATSSNRVLIFEGR